MTWPNVALKITRYYAELVPALASSTKTLPTINLKHLKKLTDRFGIIQFAKLSEPDPSSGYTLDDNARALIVTETYFQKYHDQQSWKLLNTYLDFIKQAQKKDGSFFNLFNIHKRPIETRRDPLDDADARAMWALANIATNKSLPLKIQLEAKNIFDQGVIKKLTFTSLRSAAIYIKGLVAMTNSNNNYRAALIKHANILLRGYNSQSSDKWQWFESCLSYSNSFLPEALILAYSVTKNKKCLDLAVKSLNFLINETYQNGIYCPIGQCGWYKKGGKRSWYDQQPEDVSAMVRSLKTFYEITGDEKYKKLMLKTFYWFLGDNVLGQVVYDNTTGGCYDGVGKDHINLNQGAESTVCYLLARLEVQETIKAKQKGGERNGN